MTTLQALECPLCEFLSPNLSLRISHLRLVHSSDPAFHVVCGIENCSETFWKFSAFSSHVYRHHRTPLGLTDLPASSTSDLQSPSGQVPQLSLDPEEPLQSAVLTREPVPPTTVRSDFESQAAAKFILHLLVGRSLSQVAISELIRDCQTLCCQSVHQFQEQVKDTYGGWGGP